MTDCARTEGVRPVSLGTAGLDWPLMQQPFGSLQLLPVGETGWLIPGCGKDPDDDDDLRPDTPGEDRGTSHRARLLIVEDDWLQALDNEAALLEARFEVVGLAAIALRERLGIPCVFVTAHSDRETRKRSESAFPLGWLVKPYTHQQLVDAVDAALSKLK